jgi:hypothetical protein
MFEEEGETDENLRENLDLPGNIRSDRIHYNYQILAPRDRHYTRYGGVPSKICNL